MVFTRHEPGFSRQDPALYHGEGLFVESYGVSGSRIRPNKQKKMWMPANLFVCRMGSDYHFLPRANITERIDATTWKVEPFQVLKPGDTLTFVEPHLSLTIDALAQDATVDITVGGRTDTFTFAGTAGTTTADAAAEIADFINNKAAKLMKIVRAVASENVVHLFAKDGYTTYDVATAGGTIVASNSGTMVASKPFGQILTFDEDTPEQLTLAAAATNESPVGGKVGVEGISEIIGIHTHATTWEGIDIMTLGITSSGSRVNLWALPYWDWNCFEQSALDHPRNPKGGMY